MTNFRKKIQPKCIFLSKLGIQIFLLILVNLVNFLTWSHFWKEQGGLICIILANKILRSIKLSLENMVAYFQFVTQRVTKKLNISYYGNIVDQKNLKRFFNCCANASTILMIYIEIKIHKSNDIKNKMEFI